MTIRDRGNIDEYEIEYKVHYAMEYAFFVNVKVWRERFLYKSNGRICRLDELRKEIYIKDKEGHIEKMAFDEIIELEVME